MKVNKIPTTAEIEREFSRFEYMAKERMAMEREIRNDIIDFFEESGYFRTPYRLSPPLVFRARATDGGSLDEVKAKFDRVARLTYPNGPAVSIRQGRCNNKDEAVFYCTNENGVPIFEVHPQVGDYVVLAQFRNKTTGPITFQAPMVGVKQIRENLTNRRIAPVWQEMLQNDWLFLTEHEHLIKIDDMVSEWFLKAVDNSNRHFYQLTTIIYKIFTQYTLYGPQKTLMDGLIYPSVASNISGVNFALKTELVDESFDFFGAILYHFERINPEGHMELRILKQVWAHEITEGDKLNWNDIDFNGGSDLLILGTDLSPSEFPQFDPDDYIAKLKDFSK